MITGLRVTGTVYPYKYKGSSRQTGVKQKLDTRDISTIICPMAL
jgi:hypothetical protein